MIKLLVMSSLILQCLLSANPVFAEKEGQTNPDYIFYKGNSHYEEGNYSGAIEEYLKLPALGKESGNLYYNIGNSYFKKGDLGKAVLYYEKAKKLIPRDSDLKSNHSFARSLIKHNITGEKVSWLKNAFALFNAFTINEMAILLSIFFGLLFLFLILRLFVPAARKISIMFIAASIIAFIMISISLFNRTSLINKESIVIAESSEARFEPLASATTHFTLHEGMKIYLLHSKAEWAKVKRTDGKIGWVRKQDIEKI